MLGGMFDADAFVANCRAALGEAQPMLAVKDLLARAVADPSAVEAGLGAQPGVDVLHRDDELTVVSVVVPAGLPPSLPHDHRMWAVVGIYGGQEDNQFFRRSPSGLEASGGCSITASETLALGADAVHAICNPLDHSALAAIHVYGGDLLRARRSMWTIPGYQEHPYDEREVLRGGRFRDATESPGG